MKMTLLKTSILAMAIILVGCEKEEKVITKKAAEVIKVRTWKIKPRQFAENLKLYGKVEPSQIANLISYDAGEVNSIFVKEGQFVRSGQSLCNIDADIQQAKFDAAKIQKEVIEKNLESVKARVEAGSASPLDLNQVEIQLAQATQAYLTTAKVVKGSVCRAPFSGEVAKVHIEAHQNITAGTPTITLINNSKVKVEFGVPEAEIAFFKKGKELEVVSTFDETIRENGKIDELAGVLTQPERNYTATTVLNNKSKQWKPGQNVIVNVEGMSDENAIIVPTSAILPRVEDDEIFVVRENKAVAIRIKNIASNERYTLIRSDVIEGDQLIVEGQTKVIDGGAVTILGEVTE